MGAVIYLRWPPSEHWTYLGYLHNASPSQLFKVTQVPSSSFLFFQNNIFMTLFLLFNSESRRRVSVTLHLAPPLEIKRLRMFASMIPQSPSFHLFPKRSIKFVIICMFRILLPSSVLKCGTWKRLNISSAPRRRKKSAKWATCFSSRRKWYSIFIEIYRFYLISLVRLLGLDSVEFMIPSCIVGWCWHVHVARLALPLLRKLCSRCAEQLDRADGEDCPAEHPRQVVLHFWEQAQAQHRLLAERERLSTWAATNALPGSLLSAPPSLAIVLATCTPRQRYLRPLSDKNNEAPINITVLIHTWHGLSFRLCCECAPSRPPSPPIFTIVIVFYCEIRWKKMIVAKRWKDNRIARCDGY